MKTYRNVAVIAAAVVGLSICISGCGPATPFPVADLDDYEQAVADLEHAIQFQRVTQREQTGYSLWALRSQDQPTDPLAVWSELRPLLEEEKPGPADFAAMRRHVGALMVLADMFNDEVLVARFERLLSTIISGDGGNEWRR